jgi:hypothetical protein
MSKIENLEQFDSYRTFHNCVVITIPGRDGFLWIEPGGEVHNADMNINVTLADVEVFFDSATGKMSTGWIKKRTAL